MTSPPLTISCIIPLYNAAPTIRAALASLQAQTFPRWHAIVVDDGSTDDSTTIVRQLAATDRRITLIHQPNRGVSSARNTGLSLARAEFLHFLDADDLLLPTAFDLLLPIARAHGAALAGYELADASARLIGRQTPASLPWTGLDHLLDANRIQPNCQLLRRDLLGHIRFNESLTVSEDWDLWLRLAHRGIRWKGIERMVGVYRQTPASLTKRFADLHAAVPRVLTPAYERARDAAQPRGNPDIDCSPERFRRALDEHALLHATMAALAGNSSEAALAHALAILASRTNTIGPGAAAQSASTALFFGACAVPTIDGHSERAWLPPVIAWWSRCAALGHMPPTSEGGRGEADDVIENALRALAAKLVHPDAIADALLDAHAPQRPLILAHADPRARRLARRAGARGFDTTLCQGTASDHDLEMFTMLGDVPNVRVHPGNQSRADPEAITIGPEHWSRAHAALSDANYQRLRAALDTPPPHSSASPAQPASSHRD